MAVSPPHQAAAAAAEELDDGELKRAIVELVSGFSIEVTPGIGEQITTYRDHLPAGTRVYVTWLPGSEFSRTLAAAAKLRRQGMVPVPHLAARDIRDERQLESHLVALRDDAGVEDVLLIAGGLAAPRGAFESTMQVLETGLLERHGIRRIGVAGHPEGNRDIGESGLWAALREKNAYARRSTAEFRIVTQFCFETGPVVAWAEAIAARGNTLPIQIGLPGVTSVGKLIDYARSCGVGPSLRVLTRRGHSVLKLAGVKAPDALVLELAAYRAVNPDSSLAGSHLFPLGGFERTASWALAVAEGKFRIRTGRGGLEVDA